MTMLLTGATGDWLQARAEATGDKPFLHLDGASLSFAQVDALTGRAAAFLAERGVAPGDHVAILLPNGLSFVLSLLALMRLHAVAVPLNTRLTRAEIAWQIQNAECKLALCDEATAPQLGGGSTTRLVMPDLEQLPDASPLPPAPCDLESDCVIVHTSGTSGRPKAAVLTRSSLFHSALASAFRLGVLPDDRWLCILPLYHVGGLSVLLRSLLYGTAVDLPALPRFDAAALDRMLREKPITLVSLVPTMLTRLLDAKTADWTPRLRLILLGGEATPAALVARCMAAGIPIAASYGLSEAASQAATALPESLRVKPESVGKPLLFTRIRVVDEGGAELPAGAPGELLLQGPSLMRRYHGAPEATATALRDGWLHTGDIGYLDADGDLFVLQRREDLIVSGGENVYPVEVEDALRAHPAIAEAVALGIKDEAWGQRVSAAIQLKPGENASAEQICAFLRRRLAGYKIPRQICFVDVFPRAASGKIIRRDVRKVFDD